MQGQQPGMLAISVQQEIPGRVRQMLLVLYFWLDDPQCNIVILIYVRHSY